jgi:hypothetical protein
MGFNLIRVYSQCFINCQIITNFFKVVVYRTTRLFNNFYAFLIQSAWREICRPSESPSFMNYTIKDDYMQVMSLIS